MKKVYFKRDYVTIYYSEEKSLGGAVWSGFMNSEEFREAVWQCIKVTNEFQLTHWLADNRGLKAIRQADQAWMLQVAGPEMAKSSLRKMATLIPADIFGQMALESLFTKGNDFIRFDNAFFKNESEALLWLLTDTPYSSIKHTDSHQPA